MSESTKRVYKRGWLAFIAPDGSDFLMPPGGQESVYLRKGYVLASRDSDRTSPLEDGDWSGRRCFVIGGGPSLKGFDWSLLDGELSIGINRAIEYYTPTVSFSIDSRWYKWTTNGDLGELAKERYANFRGHKVQLRADQFDYPQEVQTLKPFTHPRELSSSLHFGLAHGDNSGMAAINLAVCLGASEIYLLGFDCDPESKVQEHYHDGYPQQQRGKVYKKFAASMNLFAPGAKGKAKIINCNPDSALTCWDFGNAPWDSEENPEVAETSTEKPTRPPVEIPTDIHDDMWKDEPCVIVGGGTSIKNFDFEELTGIHTIAVNRAFEVCDPSVILAADHKFYDWISNGSLGKETKARFESLDCLKILGAAVSVFDGFYELTHIMANEPKESDLEGDLTESFDDGLLRSTCSGIPALNFALNAGANPIYLLGFDCQPDTEGIDHFHNGYPSMSEEKNQNQPYEMHMAGFERIADAAKKRANIVNCSNWSALTCFEFGKIPAYEPDTERTKPVYVSFATPAYREELKELKATLDAHDCEHDLRHIKSRGEWEQNCGYKATFIQSMRKKHKGRPIVWVDADSRVRQQPELLEAMNGADVAFCRLDGELLSAVLYFAPTGKATRLITRWRKAQAADPMKWDQKVLDDALGGWNGEVGNLPSEYCRIFDNDAQHGVVPVIEQMQASRRLKGAKQ